VSTINEAPVEGMFVRPFGLALSGDTLYVQTDGNSLGQPGTPGGALWRMPAGGGAPELLRDNIGRCRGLSLLSDGRLAMTDFRSHVVQIYDPNASSVSLLAGGLNAPGYRDGQSTEASFNQPYDLLELGDGTILVADFGNNRLRAVALDGTVSTFAGTGAAGRDDGALATASFNAPQGLAMDDAGNIYVTDTGNYLIRKISPDGQVTTVAGNASPGYLDDEDPLAGQLFGIEGIDILAGGYAYIADGTRGEAAPYHRIRRLTLE
jgi:sugar lactone lactonase YvrE